MSQYRSHGYLFNLRGVWVMSVRFCLNTVLTVISLIVNGLDEAKSGLMSQYRSHGYLFNHVHFSSYVYRCWSQYRSHGYLFNRLRISVNFLLRKVSIPFSRLSL